MSTILTKQYPHFQYLEHYGLSVDLKEKLHKEFHILEEDVDDIFSPTQLSKFEIRKNYAYFALQFADIDSNDRICLQQIHCLVSQKYFFVIDEDGFMGIREFDKIRNNLVTKEDYNSFDLFYELLDISVIRMFRLLTSIQNRVRSIESTIFADSHLENDQISEIQDTKKSIVNFKSILSPLYDMFEELSLKHTDLIDETGKESIDDSLDKIKKLVNRLDNFREITKLLTETNEMIMARSTNQTVKRLTMFNVLLLVPSLTAAFFGMNVHFGWFSVHDDQLWPLLTIVGIMFGFTIGIYLFFTWKKWI